MIRGVWTIATREFASLFRLPVGWIVVALFAFLSALMFVQHALRAGEPATMRYFFMMAAWMMAPVAPAISMRLLAEESRSGTMEMLRTSPLGDFSIALGKLLGAWLFLGVMLAVTLVLPATLYFTAEPAPDPGPIVAGYLMLILLGGLCLGVGLVASALTSSQTLAFLGSLMAIVLFMIVTSSRIPGMGTRVTDVLATLSVSDRVAEFARGVIDSGSAAYFLIGTALSVVLAAGVLESRRLSRPKIVAGSLWIVFLAATVSSALLAGLLTTQHRIRFDVTSTNAHRLSERAERTVDLVTGPTELVFAVDRARADNRIVDLVSDVVDAYAARSDLIDARLIDLSSAIGQRETDDLLATLFSRETDRFDRTRNVLAETAASLREMARELEPLSVDLTTVRDSIPVSATGADTNRAFFDQRSALVRVALAPLIEQGDAIDASLNAAGSDLPELDLLVNPAANAWRSQRDQLTDLSAQVRAFAESEIAGENERLFARSAADRTERLRDRAAQELDRLERLPKLDTLRVKRALESGESLLIVGPPDVGIAAVDLEALLLPTEALDRVGVSPAGIVGPRAQELIATAISRLSRPERPILIFTHGGRPGELLQSTDLFTRVSGMLRDRGMDVLEWAAAEEIEPPDLGRIDPSGARPVVYAVISADSSAGSNDGQLTGAQRSKDLAAAVQRVLQRGAPVLLSLNPSIFPSFGDPDPMVALAQPYGISADTGSVILHPGRSGSSVGWVTNAIPDSEDNPIGAAVLGLPVAMPWAVPLSVTDAQIAQPLVTLTGQPADEAWAESRWLRIKSTPANARALIADQPVYNEVSDLRTDSWLLAAAGSRRIAGGEARMVVVGSNGWSSDSASMGVERLVDGRVAKSFPGNAVLLESAIHWLAGQEELIAPGSEARPVAMVKTLTPGQLSTFRAVLLGLVPGLVLLTGAAYRGLRG